ncbi:MAG TPA: ROK family protein [Bacteroidia bacterium]|nr:ROK family protein [Bacteroidia bacterium]HNP97623.1 ROK family protein [Bacteroidia bacterium]
MQTVTLGVDIGGTNTSFGLVDRKGQILSKHNIPTPDFPEAKNLAAEVSRYASEQVSQLKFEARIVSVGIGAPNGNYFNGTIEFAPNLNWKGVIPLAAYFAEQLNVPAVLTNDANAASLGEMYFGGAKGMKDFLFITLGTGLGSGIVANGDLIYGHDGFAGELGHTIIIQHGRMCGCGRRGCLEQYCSATGIVKTYLDIVKGMDGHSMDGDIPNAKKIYEKAMAGEEAAFYAFNYTGELLGFALANAVAYTSPEAIFLFGGLAEAGELLFNPTILSFEKNLLNIYKNKIKILPSSLLENDAAILGAASLAWKEVDKKVNDL